MTHSLSKSGYPHRLVAPINIFLSEDNHIKLIDSFALSKTMSGNDTEYILALSPERLKEAMDFKMMREKESNGKDISWAIGLTVLCAASCSQIQSFYNLKTMTVRMEQIKEKLEFLKVKVDPYSENLVNLLERCLEFEERGRVSLDELFDFLAPFSINNKSATYLITTPRFIKASISLRSNESNF